jgi:hypothetical protein
MLKFTTRSRSSDAPVRRGLQLKETRSHAKTNNPTPPSQANIGSAWDIVPTTNLAIANYSAKHITLVLGLVLKQA